jgi:hypothetical protein
MAKDIDSVVRGWPYKNDVVQARLIPAHDGRQVLQMRIELGILQLEVAGRPDGQRPHGYPTYFDYLQAQAAAAAELEQPFVLEEEHCRSADREFTQFYHRRVCWLALRQFDKAVADADHTLAFMDWLKEHSPSEEFTQAHEQYRGFVVFHRTQALAAGYVEREQPEAAIDALRQGLEQLRGFFAQFGVEDRMEEDGMVQQLRSLERKLRQAHGIDATLEEQLQQAIANEHYEAAARIRDQLRQQKLR